MKSLRRAGTVGYGGGGEHVERRERLGVVGGRVDNGPIPGGAGGGMSSEVGSAVPIG